MVKGDRVVPLLSLSDFFLRFLCHDGKHDELSVRLACRVADSPEPQAEKFGLSVRSANGTGGVSLHILMKKNCENCTVLWAEVAITKHLSDLANHGRKNAGTWHDCIPWADYMKIRTEGGVVQTITISFNIS